MGSKRACIAFVCEHACNQEGGGYLGNSGQDAVTPVPNILRDPTPPQESVPPATLSVTPRHQPKGRIMQYLIFALWFIFFYVLGLLLGTLVNLIILRITARYAVKVVAR